MKLAVIAYVLPSRRFCFDRNLDSRFLFFLVKNFLIGGTVLINSGSTVARKYRKSGTAPILVLGSPPLMD